MTYWLINVYSSLAVEWKTGFELVQDFLKDFNTKLLIGFSFNRYFRGNYIHPKFEFRCNFSSDEDGKKEAEKRLNSFKASNKVCHFDNWVPFQRRDAVIKSAEIASSWSITFFEQLIRSPDIASSFSADRMMFLSRFIPIILQEHGIDANLLTSDVDDTYISRLRELSRVCKTSSNYPFPQKPSIDFLERVIHFFVNCVLSNDVEGDVRFHLMWVNWLGNLSKRPEQNP
jgi:hypothetical protein